MQYFVLRFYPAQFVLRMGYLVGCILDRGVVLLQLQFEFGDFQDSQHVTRLHAAAVVHTELSYIAGLFRVNLDFLEGHQLGRERKRAPQRFSADLGDADRIRLWCGAYRIGAGGALRFTAGRQTPSTSRNDSGYTDY